MPDPSTFDDFYLATRAQTLRQLTAMTADRDLAADVVQDAYERAWRSWRRVSQLQQPQAWVRTVAWHAAVSQYRRTAVAARFLPLLARRATEGASAPTDDRLDVEAALRRIGPERRRALVLHDLCGLTVAEVAAETGVAEGTVKSRLSRARAELAGLLDVKDVEAGHIGSDEPGRQPSSSPAAGPGKRSDEEVLP
jgi:RNA polymerase sigma factor (sigma-70 family)